MQVAPCPCRSLLPANEKRQKAVVQPSFYEFYLMVIRNVSTVEYFREIRFKEKKNSGKVASTLAVKCNIQINHHALIVPSSN